MNMALAEFSARAEEFNVFTNLKSLNKANHVFSHWYGFSLMMPKFLTQAASMVESSEQMLTLVQTAWEELGEGHADAIHSEMFKACGEDIGLTLSPIEINGPVKFLDTKPRALAVLGYAFGLEVIANENIAFLFDSLAYDQVVSEKLKRSLFFKIHFVNEDRHIEMNFKNFARFCTTKQHEEDFMTGFDQALIFWRDFWAKACEEKCLH